VNKTMGHILGSFWIGAFLRVSLCQAAPPKIDLPNSSSELAQPEAAAPLEEPMSTSVIDENDKNWTEYNNRIVQAHVRVKSAWPVIEIKETKTNGSVSFTLSNAPGPLVTFTITNQPMDGPFEAWVSSSSLTPLYPSGYKEFQAVFAGRKATLIKGTAADGRLEESYFSARGEFINQVSFTAPKEYWKDFEPAFAALKQSFRWLP